VPLTPGEKATYGVARDYVDICASGECYAGATSAPPELGTIMSYCHNIVSGGFRQARYQFWKAGETSEKMLTILKTGDPSNFTTGLEGATANPTISNGATPIPCAAGQTASVAACGGCTYAWQITGGSITSSTTSNSITYTPSGPSTTLTVTVTRNGACGITASKTLSTSCASLGAPTNVVATALSASSIQITWSAVGGASSYNVYRNDGVTNTLAGNTAGLTLTDNAVSGNKSYLYTVKAFNGAEGPASNVDLATTVIFTDPTLVAGTTPTKAAHINELRTAVNAVRTLAALGAGSYTDVTLIAGTTEMKGLHITDLRAALNAARTALSLTAVSYTDPVITAGTTVIKTANITDLRGGVQ
jgi:hypothetical protein